MDILCLADNQLAKDIYLTGCIRDRPVKRKRTKIPNKSARKQYSYIVHHNQVDYDICRRAFASLHACGYARIQRLVDNKLSTPTGTPVPDKRGKHPSGNQIPGPQVDKVHEHIQTLAVQSSHYGRSKTPHRRYLSGEVAQMQVPELFQHYVEWLHATYPNETAVLESFYRAVFTKRYNIVPRPPKTDVCDFCSATQMEIQLKGTHHSLDNRTLNNQN